MVTIVRWMSTQKRAILKKGSAEEPKTIPQFYDEEAAAASADSSTSGQFPFFKDVRSAMYKQRAKRFPRLPRDRQDLVLAPEFTRTKTQSAPKHILIFSMANNI
ncbi:hypothetical protein T06_9703 [Trichinella sp. T6]|nr:hypothetical protein T06_10640 [Trichinella sp. T6]KRX83015.1 hypothetical protein T06_9703 [Trichinella sp. T6]